MTPQCFQGRITTAVLFILLPAVSAQAVTLSLDEALQLAERNAPSLQARLEQASAARSSVIPAGELPDPRLNLGVQNLPIEGADRWSMNRDFMTMQVVGLSQDVPNREKRKARVETAQATVERADAEAVFERLKIRAATAQAWVTAYTVQRKLEHFDAFYKENQLLASTVRARLAGGAGSTADTLAPKQELAQLDEQKDVLLSQAAQARSALKRWIGQDAEVGAPTFPVWPVDAAEYLHSVHAHPELNTYNAMTREAQAQVHQAQAEKKSDWSWGVDYQRRGPDFSNMVSLQVSFQLPLFTGSRQDPMIAARRAQVRQLEDEQDAALREHQAQLETDLAEYQRLQRAVRRSRETLLPLAEDRVRLALADYRAGKSSLSEVLSARRQRVEALLQDVDLQGHLRSSLVAIVSLPVGILIALIVMRHQGINANIMSLGGIAIAIGAMVDAAVVMIENAHKRVEAWNSRHPSQLLRGEAHWKVMTEAAVEVGPALFFSLMIITLSFIPVFTLQAQEGRLFAPLAFTKTYAMAAAAALSVTLIPVLMGYWIRGPLPAEQRNPLNRVLIRLYRPALEVVLRRPLVTLAGAALILLSSLWPLNHLGGEFLPPLDEGDLLYMPSALPGLSAQKASELLQRTDRLIRTVPEVASVFGKAGRAESATDPAPLEMFETTVRLKPKSEWRTGMTTEKLIEELDRIVRVPGLTNIWIPPIRNRIDMLATGIKSPIGVKVAGSDLNQIDRATLAVERAAKKVPGVTSALAERLTGGRYIDLDIDRHAAARYGLNITDVQAIVAGAIGGETIGETVEGLARYPISVRYPREWRDSVEALRQLPIYTSQGGQLTLGTVARIRIADGPPMLKSENARPSGWVYIDVRGRDLSSVVADLRQSIDSEVKLDPGMSLSYSGQFEYLERANARLAWVVPATLAIIFVLLYLTFGRFGEAMLIMGTLPFALTGGVWLLYLLGYNLSVATGVGFIALAGVAAEFGVIMLIYLNNAWAERQAECETTRAALLDAIREGAVQRIRPKAMTVAVIVAGLLPILWSSGTGSEVMSRIAVPMVGGMLTAPLLSLFVIPAAYWLVRRRELAVTTPHFSGVIQ